MNADGTVGGDNPGSLAKPNVTFGGFDVEGYLLAGFGLHVGRFYDRSTRNSGWYFSLDLGGGLGANAGISGGSNVTGSIGPKSNGLSEDGAGGRNGASDGAVARSKIGPRLMSVSMIERAGAGVCGGAGGGGWIIPVSTLAISAVRRL